MSALIALCLIPVSTILFAGKEDWFSTNFSIIGNMIGQQGTLISWGVLVGGYFYWALQAIILRTPAAFRLAWMIPFDLILLFLAVTTPYLPNQLPLQASLHFIFAFCSAVFLLIILIAICSCLYSVYKRKFRPFLWELGGIILISFCLLIYAGFVTSALEIFFTISCSFFIYQIHRHVVSHASSSPEAHEKNQKAS